MNNKLSLSFNQKELRKTEKKIRRMKENKYWDMGKISNLEVESDRLRNKIKIESIKKDYENDQMTSDEWIDHFHEGRVEEVEEVEDYSLPNTPKMRRHRKEVIRNLNEHILGQYMDQQMLLRMNIIRQVKNDLENKECKEDKEMDEFFKVRREINDIFTSIIFLH